jgi:hypothetical protein
MFQPDEGREALLGGVVVGRVRVRRARRPFQNLHG